MSVDIAVYADWDGLTGPMRLGMLRAHTGAGREKFEFEFDEMALSNDVILGMQLDPNLRSLAGRHHPPAGQENFGLFADTSPDRWGRTLMRRRHERAQRGGIIDRSKRLHESDFLLGVHDRYRSGALRFKLDDVGEFLDDQHDRAAPPMVQLRALEAASLALERNEDDSSARVDEWLRLLIAPGGSLGGARPKASVVDPEGHLWIAKFPSVRDDHDVGAWEHLLHTLAGRCGLSVPGRMIRHFAGSHHSFLVQRFDRTPAGGRLHFASAMTLTGRHEGDDASTGASYLDLARVLVTQGADPNVDLEELWSRIVFNMLVSNADDHLRNHGFILVPGAGWRLSPAYDMNPVPDAAGLKLNVSKADNALDLELARSVASSFRVSPSKAEDIIERYRHVMRQWPQIADDQGIPQREQTRMAAAFALVGAARGATPASLGSTGASTPILPSATMRDQASLSGFGAAPVLAHRLFFGLFPDATTAARIAVLAQRLRSELGLKGKPLKTDRFHVTLHHVGDYTELPPAILAAAKAAAASVAGRPFDVVFDRAVSFRRPRNLPFVLRADETRPALKTFQHLLGQAMTDHGLGKLVDRNFTPHLTLLYDDQSVSDQFVEPIEWRVGEFVLIHSLIGKTQHIPLARWPLRG